MNTNGRINDGTSMSKSMQKKNANQLNFAEQERLLTAQMQQQDQNSKRSLEVRDAGNLTIQSRRDDDDNSVLDIEEIKTDLKGHKEVKLAEAVGKVLVAKDVLDDDESEDAAKKDLDESIGTAINHQKNGKQKYAF